jgi:lycopene beta-cyclase
MTYAQYLAAFVMLPIGLLAILLARDRLKRPSLPASLRGWPPLGIVLALSVVAVAYTAVWDDHLIALGVWDYAPRQISGWRLDRMPVEELAFIALQPVLVGLWELWLAHRLPSGPRQPARAFRVWSALLVAGAWLIGLELVLAGWRPGTYLGWELAWALPPIALQLAAAGDIFRAQWRLLAPAVMIPWVYLSATDALAIRSGIWAINPRESLGIMLAGRLPVEEAVFFLLSTALVSGGVLAGLALAAASRTSPRTRDSTA